VNWIGGNSTEKISTSLRAGKEIPGYTASSVYSEKLFSEYGNIFEEKRSRLLPKSGEKLLFLHHNVKLLDKF